jgi:hypothetical protein
MSWLAVFSSIVALIRLVLTQASERQRRRSELDSQAIGRALALKEVLDEALNLMGDAQLARRRFRDQLRAYPERLSDDDGHKRTTDRPKPTAATDGR